MRYFRSVLLLALMLVLAAVPLSPAVDAQQSGTPEAATPIATDVLSGRLGGSLESVIDTYGQPDFTSDGLVRYNEVALNGIPTILVVYYDASEQVTKLALVYATRPDALATTVGILPTAATVAPADGICDAGPVASGLGAEVYACHSNALMPVFDADQLAALDVSGALGDYAVSVDPIPDSYFEIVVLPGTDGTALDVTPVAETATEVVPEATPTLAEQYPTLADPRDLMDGDIALSAPLSFTGDILTLQLAGAGKQFHLGKDESLAVTSLFQVRIPVTGTSDDRVVFVGYSGDATDLAIGNQVTVYGTNYGTQCFENAMGDEVCQPLIAADLVEIG